MHSSAFQIDPIHTRPIAKGIADGLRFVLADQPEPKKALQALIDRLSELDKDSPPITPDQGPR
jgi:hypothetical protein